MVAQEKKSRQCMKALYPLWMQPLDFFYIHGTMCCDTMINEYTARHFVHYALCYDARSITAANVVVLWGSFSKKLCAVISEELEIMNKKDRSILHIRGCRKRVENDFSSSALASLPLNVVHSSCMLQKSDYRKLIREARQCLRA